MYTPKAFKVDDHEQLIDFIKKHSFGVLFSQDENGPSATHLPLLFDESQGEKGRLLSHMAKANPHWKDLNHKEVLVVFSGPHAYVSPTWYKEERTVPTWNYVAVHVYGEFKWLEDKQKMRDLLTKTVDFYEVPMASPWKTDFDESYIEASLKGIIGFEVLINKIEGKWKLNQNNSIERQQNAVEGLRSTHQYDSQEIAKLMQQSIRLQQEKKTDGE